MIKALEGVNTRAFLDEKAFRAIARELFIKLDMVRACDSDYENAIETLKAMYNAGQDRANQTHGSGCMG